MCMSRFHRVLREAGPGAVEVEDVDGTMHRVSLLALDGPPPAPGEWLVVHSGYAIDRVDAAEAEEVMVEIRSGSGTAAGAAIDNTAAGAAIDNTAAGAAIDNTAAGAASGARR